LAPDASFAVIWFWFGPNAYDGRGYTHYEKKEYDKAISDFTEAIRLSRTMPRLTIAGMSKAPGPI
jgi:Tetratricopeptide repeat